MVSLVPGPASVACVSPQQAVGTVHHPVRRAAGVCSGPAPVRDVHGWCCQHRREPRCLRRTSTPASVAQTTRRCSTVTLLAASNRSPAEWAWTVFNWMPKRWNSYGLFHHFGAISFRQVNLLVTQAAWVHDLGVYLDSNMSMRSHVTRLVCTCFGILWQICSISWSVTRLTLSMFISAFIMSKLDYCNVSSHLPAKMWPGPSAVRH